MKKRLLIDTLIIFFMVCGWMAYANSADAPRMTKEELKAMMGSSDLVIIDVRSGTDWADSDLKIKVAVREDLKFLNPGRTNILRIKPSFSIVPEPKKEQVPVWHKS